MKLKITSAGKVRILEMNGRLTLGEGDVVLRDAVRALVAEGHVNLVFNMKHVTRLDSSGMGEMCSSLYHVKKQGGRIHLLLPSDKVLFTIGMVGLRLRFPAFTSEVNAVAAFLEPPQDEAWTTQRKADTDEVQADAVREEAAETAE